MMKNRRNASGGAPELLQHKVKEELKAQGPVVEKAMEEKVKQDLFSMQWWYQEGMENVQKTGHQIQELLNGIGDIQIAPVQEGSEWKLASEWGFRVLAKGQKNEEESPDHTPLGTPKTREEERLEQLPDDELKVLAVQSGLFPPGEVFDRAKMVKNLLEAQVLPPE